MLGLPRVGGYDDQIINSELGSSFSRMQFAKVSTNNGNRK